MPVQIDELIITTTVNPQGVAGGTTTPSPIATTDTAREIAEKVLQIIREKSER